MSGLTAKRHHWLGLRPRPRWGSLQRSPDPLAGFQGPTSKGVEGRERGGVRGDGRQEKGEGRGGKRGGEEREGRRREGERGEEAFLLMWPRRLSALNPPLVEVQKFLHFYVMFSTGAR